MSRPWIGLDLDGTLAHFDTWKGNADIGKPIPKMLCIARACIANGFKVKIFTARVCNGPDAFPPIRKWLKENGLPPDLEITNVKDLDCLEIHDDLAIAYETNTGKRLGGQSILDTILGD